MKRYRVTTARTEVVVFEVDADSADEAAEFFHDGEEVDQFYEVPSDCRWPAERHDSLGVLCVTEMKEEDQ